MLRIYRAVQCILLTHTQTLQEVQTSYSCLTLTVQQTVKCNPFKLQTALSYMPHEPLNYCIPCHYGHPVFDKDNLQHKPFKDSMMPQCLCSFAVVMHRWSSVWELLAGAALVHQANPSGVYQLCNISMMHELVSNSSELHSSIITVKESSTLKRYVALRGLNYRLIGGESGAANVTNELALSAQGIPPHCKYCLLQQALNIHRQHSALMCYVLYQHDASPGLHSCIMPTMQECIDLVWSAWCLNAALVSNSPGLHSCIISTMG